MDKGIKKQAFTHSRIVNSKHAIIELMLKALISHLQRRSL